jgi:nitroimidazol reductase NimA-like FMN-containing flavoprotein (pyridoxamine 5'-phosphate oxidase superfamily)
LVRTCRGTKLDAAMQNVVVAFEVDDFDSTYHTGWSVAITGVASTVSDPEMLEQARHQPIPRWAPAGDEALIAISTEVVSGRRITTASRAMRALNTG